MSIHYFDDPNQFADVDNMVRQRPVAIGTHYSFINASIGLIASVEDSSNIVVRCA